MNLKIKMNRYLDFSAPDLEGSTDFQEKGIGIAFEADQMTHMLKWVEFYLNYGNFFLGVMKKGLVKEKDLDLEYYREVYR